MKRFSACLVLLAASALAQLRDGPIVMGHLHIRSADIAANHKFWTALLETEARRHGNLEVFRYPGGFLLLQSAASGGGTAGSVLDHTGFEVRSLKAALERLREAGFDVPPATGTQAFVVAPGDVRVELIENTGLSAPVAGHHIHFYTAAVDEMKAWYVKTFGAVPGKRGKFEAADLPGINLSFSPAQQAPAPSKGRVLDHVGFEVRALEAFCRQLEGSGVKFAVAYRKIPELGVAVAFLTDPWGTNIELTEGLRDWDR